MAGGFASLVLKTVSQAPRPMQPDDPRLPNGRAIAEILAMFRQLVKDEPFLFFASSVVLRRTGAWQEAIWCAHQALSLKTDWNGAIGLACAYRDAGRVNDAVKASFKDRSNERLAFLLDKLFAYRHCFGLHRV